MAKTPEIEGVKEAVRALRKIDPAMRKTFNTNVKAVVATATIRFIYSCKTYNSNLYHINGSMA